MKKSLCVIAVLVFAAFALSFGSARYRLTSPVIVSSGRVINRDTLITNQSIFTTTEEGVYRVSAYATLTKSDPNSLSSWYYAVEWTDAAASGTSAILISQPGNGFGQFYSYFNPQLHGSA